MTFPIRCDGSPTLYSSALFIEALPLQRPPPMKNSFDDLGTVQTGLSQRAPSHLLSISDGATGCGQACVNTTIQTNPFKGSPSHSSSSGLQRHIGTHPSGWCELLQSRAGVQVTNAVSAQRLSAARTRPGTLVTEEPSAGVLARWQTGIDLGRGS